MLSQLAQPLLSGTLMGGVYGLIALGLSLVFGVMRVSNFAHGDLLMIAMYISVALWEGFGISPYVSIFGVAIFMFFVGVFIQKAAITPILKSEKERSPLRLILFTVGLSIFLQNLVLMIKGGAPVTATVPLSTQTLPVGDLIVSIPRLLAFVLSIVITVILWFFISKTDTGRAMRAVSQDRETSLLMGINEYKTYAIAFGIGTVLLGLAASMVSTFLYAFPTMGSSYTLRSYVIVALGGIGSIPGAMIGGLVVGIIESISAQFMPASYSEVVIFIIFILVLVIKPSGMFGKERK
ncbi:MAG: branched-chain amino acid ABC transporter permease [Eubacteriales bacterium]|nr:branched-chain amino acid ABC transporter permease [Eubacteriales bacterium]MDD4324044.1 branched-chain amino acid ABC transporter permease [Eubacteriales bacterium]MDD4541516.1 branched-chain amino acid ABC transporter permease [Eubacteriales bacterium]